MSAVLAIDAGTTGVRTRAVFSDGRPSFSSYREFTQHFPRPGWVEHDAAEIWDKTLACARQVIEGAGGASHIAANRRKAFTRFTRNAPSSANCAIS